MNAETIVSSSFKLADVIKVEINPLDDALVGDKVDLIANWWDTHPNHVVEADTVGRFVRTRSVSYHYVEGGVGKYKVDYETFEATRSHMVIINEGGGNFFIYWPETDGYVGASFVFDYEEGLAAVQGIDPSALSYKTVLFNSTLSRVCVEVEGGGFELHLTFNAVDVGINPPGQIEMIFHATADGQITRLEQNRLGISQTTDFVYREYPDATGVLAEIAADDTLRNCPDSSVRAPSGTYDEEAQKNILYFRFEEGSA